MKVWNDKAPKVRWLCAVFSFEINHNFWCVRGSRMGTKQIGFGNDRSLRPFL
jgi:hypothetical protein